MEKRGGLSGWRRAWIVLSVIFGVPSAIAGALGPDYTEYEYGISDRLVAQALVNAKASDMKPKCLTAPDVKGEYNPYTRDWSLVGRCVHYEHVLLTLVFAVLPAAMMAGVGLTVRWVYRGFRPKPSGQ